MPIMIDHNFLDIFSLSQNENQNRQFVILRFLPRAINSAGQIIDFNQDQFNALIQGDINETFDNIAQSNLESHHIMAEIDRENEQSSDLSHFSGEFFNERSIFVLLDDILRENSFIPIFDLSSFLDQQNGEFALRFFLYNLEMINVEALGAFLEDGVGDRMTQYLQDLVLMTEIQLLVSTYYEANRQNDASVIMSNGHVVEVLFNDDNSQQEDNQSEYDSDNSEIDDQNYTQIIYGSDDDSDSPEERISNVDSDPNPLKKPNRNRQP